MNPSGLGGDPPDPRACRPGARSIRAARSRVGECPTTDVELWPAGDGTPSGVRPRPGRRRDGVSEALARDAGSARPLRRRAAADEHAPSTASTSTVRARRGARARRRVRLRQDDARADAPRARAAGRRRGPLRGRAAALRRRVPPPVPRRRCRWSSRTRWARSTRARRCTRRSPRGLRIQKAPGDEADARRGGALARAGLRPPERFFQLYPYELSGGQRQRVVIAGAMVLNPSLLVADEPVSSLDASVRGEILKLMLELVREAGVTVLVVTHDLGLAWNIADRIAVMYLGRIVEEGPAEELLSNPRHPYTRALLSVVPEVEEMEQQILRARRRIPTRIPSGCRFHPRCPLVASGEAARLGIEERCRTEDSGSRRSERRPRAASPATRRTGRETATAAGAGSRARSGARRGRCRPARPPSDDLDDDVVAVASSGGRGAPRSRTVASGHAMRVARPRRRPRVAGIGRRRRRRARRTAPRSSRRTGRRSASRSS